MNPKNSLLFSLPLTRIKFAVASILYKIVSTIFRNGHRVIRRKGVWYKIDLKEGIDFSLFLLGTFQQHITSYRYFSLPENAVIFDVGANIGVMSLQYAKNNPSSKVYAFEANETVYEKLITNISLNPGLSQQIAPVLSYVSSTNESVPDETETYASWRLDGSRDIRHPIHEGIKKAHNRMRQISLDEFSISNNISHVDLIKIDTDGHEYQVLKGCRHIIEKHGPVIIFEISQYLMQEHRLRFEDYFSFLFGQHYLLINSKTGSHIGLDNYAQHIPLRYTIDIIALPCAPR